MSAIHGHGVSCNLITGAVKAPEVLPLSSLFWGRCGGMTTRVPMNHLSKAALQSSTLSSTTVPFIPEVWVDVGSDVNTLGILDREATLNRESNVIAISQLEVSEPKSRSCSH